MDILKALINNLINDVRIRLQNDIWAIDEYYADEKIDTNGVIIKKFDKNSVNEKKLEEFAKNIINEKLKLDLSNEKFKFEDELKMDVYNIYKVFECSQKEIKNLKDGYTLTYYCFELFNRRSFYEYVLRSEADKIQKEIIDNTRKDILFIDALDAIKAKTFLLDQLISEEEENREKFYFDISLYNDYIFDKADEDYSMYYDAYFGHETLKERLEHLKGKKLNLK